MLCNRLPDRRRIDQKFLVLDGDELWVRGGCVIRRTTAGKDDPRRERATSQIGDLANAIVGEETT